MKRYVIEREIPGIGAMSASELATASAQSNRALEELAPRVQWLESFLTGGKSYCIYLAESEADVQRHAELSGFPANIVTEVTHVIDPTTAA